MFKSVFGLRNLVMACSQVRLAVIKHQILQRSKCSSSASLDKITGSLDKICSNSTDSRQTDLAAASIVNSYISLAPDEKQQVLLALAKNYQTDWPDLRSELTSITNSDHQTPYKMQQHLRESLVQPYETVFKAIGAVEGGVKFLVDLRADLIKCCRESKDLSELSSLQYMNYNLKQLLSLWFGIGFLQLERITWQSPCDLLEKVAEYEAVHPVRNVSDLRGRVGSHRRCFIFTHPSMPREPVVILHVALVNGISSNIQSIVRTMSLANQRQYEADQEDLSSVDAAIFYSITSTKPGLQGIDLGNYLIKTVVKELQAELPHLKQFSSLSPIPGFRSWLVTEINQELSSVRTGFLSADQLNQLAALLHCPAQNSSSILNEFKATLQTGMWAQDSQLADGLRPILMELCVRYLYAEKHRGYALNSVANFHLRNGATLWRVNWMANTSAKGLGESCGIMVNYRYYLDKTEANYLSYNNYKIIDVDEQVLDLL